MLKPLLKLFSILIGTTVLMISLTRLIPYFSQNGYKPELWGTVSDWVMIVATVGSLFVIWRTLVAQLALLKLETTKYREAVRPHFALSVVDGQFINDWYNRQFIIKFKLSISNKVVAQQVTFRHTSQLNKWTDLQELNRQPLPILQPDRSIKMEFKYEPELSIPSTKKRMLIISVMSNDVVGKPYEQHFSLDVNDGSPEISEIVDFS